MWFDAESKYNIYNAFEYIDVYQYTQKHGVPLVKVWAQKVKYIWQKG